MLPTKRISTHPGEVLQDKFLTPMDVSQSRLARHIGVNHDVICNICNGKSSVTPRLAVMLGRAFDVSAEFWIGLQMDYDLTKLRHTPEGKRAHAVPPLREAV